MKPYQIIILVIVAFAAGNLTHDYMPTFNNHLGEKIVAAAVGYDTSAATTNTSSSQEADTLNTRVEYANGAFSKKEVRMKVQDYLIITNRDEKERMFLVSDNPILSTPRSYGYTEQLRVQIPTAGTYTITNKLNTNAVLKVVVEEGKY